MKQLYILERDGLKTFADVVTQSHHSSDGYSSCSELLCTVEPGQAEMQIRTHSDLSPVQAVVTVPLQTSCKLGLAITISCDGLFKSLKMITASKFIGFEVDGDKLIRVFSVIPNTFFDEPPEFIQIDIDSNYWLPNNRPELLTNYIEMPITDVSCQVKLRAKQKRVINSINSIGRANRQPEHTVIVCQFDDDGAFIELQSEEVFCRFQMSEEPSDVQVSSVMSFSHFKAMNAIISQLLSEKMHSSLLLANNEKTLILHSAVTVQLLCQSHDKMFVAPKLSFSDDRFVEDEPHQLARHLDRLAVAPTNVDDVITLQMFGQTLTASINTETAVADLRINVKQSGNGKPGSAFDVKRKLLINCLKSFPPGQYVRIHGLLTDEPNIVIQSTVNNDVVVIAKMQNIDQAAA